MHFTQADYSDTSHQCCKWTQCLGATASKDLPSFDNVAVTSQQPVHPSRPQNRTGDLVIPSCLNEFVKGNEHKLHVFGEFTW